MIRWLVMVFYLALAFPAWSANSIHTAPGVEPIRALHFVLRGVPLDRAHWLVDKAKQAGINTIIVMLTDGVILRTAPWREQRGAWSPDEFKAWVEYAQGAGLHVVPEIKLLTHQEKFLQDSHPELMFNRHTYDPRNPDVYKNIVFPFIDEIVGLIHPKAIHIGHDEAIGWNKRHAMKKIGKHGRPLPADLFLRDVLVLHRYLKEKNVETWMWGDMLISPDEFPGMLARHLHGSMPGYGKALRDELPKDIVICDWHYFDKQTSFPSLSKMVGEGFRVLGSTWKREETVRNFSSYAAKHGASGMIATTWFHVQRKEWDVVEKIIRTSGRIFSQDFPDAR